MSHWSFGTTFPVLAAGLVIWLVAAWLCYANWQRSGWRGTVGMLEALRLILVSLLVFTLTRPEFVRLVERTEKPEIAILVDASRSMETRDLVSTNGLGSRAEWLQQNRERQFWMSLEPDAKVVVQEFSPPPQGTPGAPANANEGTDLDAALEAILQRQRNLKAVLLLSDGDWNMGRSPVGTASRYRDRAIPIFTVAVGRDTPVPDLELESVLPPAYGLFGEQISIPFKIRNRLPREVKTSVMLLQGDREETRREVVIPALGELNEAIVWSPRAVGEADLTLRVPVEAEEVLPDNNEQHFRIAVRVETLKVLLVESSPRWEYRFLRNALARDPGVEMHSLLYHPGMAMGDGKNYLTAFPGSKELLSRYDVIFLGDVGIGENELTEADAELMKGLVEQQGSGLVFLPGRRGRHLSLLQSPLRDLIPVVLDESRPEGFSLQNESTLALSTMGKRHLLTRFDADENRNDEIWKQLPGFFWSAAVEKSRPGSEVLAVHSALRNSWGRTPLLVSRPAGSGKVLFMGTDSAWRWRRGVEDKFHYRFWSQVVRWMAHQRHLNEQDGVRLAYSPEAPQLGDTVFLQATVLDADGFPIETGTVNARVVGPSGRAERIEFTGLEGGWGVFKGSFTPHEGGTYRIQVHSPEHERNLVAELLVDQPVREKLGQPVNRAVLKEIASISQGQVVEMNELDRAIEELRQLPQPQPIERRVRLWSDPFWGGAILLLLGIYWTGRKLAGMV